MCTKKELKFSIYLIYNLAEKWALRKALRQQKSAIVNV